MLFRPVWLAKPGPSFATLEGRCDESLFRELSGNAHMELHGLCKAASLTAIKLKVQRSSRRLLDFKRQARSQLPCVSSRAIYSWVQVLWRVAVEKAGVVRLQQASLKQLSALASNNAWSCLSRGCNPAGGGRRKYRARRCVVGQGGLGLRPQSRDSPRKRG